MLAKISVTPTYEFQISTVKFFWAENSQTGLEVTVSSNYFFFNRLSSEFFVYLSGSLLKWLSPQMTGLRVTFSSSDWLKGDCLLQ